MPEANTSTDYTLPAVPDYFKTAAAGPANSYSPGTPKYGVFESYMSNLGRAPENTWVTDNWAKDPNYNTNIAASPEAQTYGRARNEINPLVNDQIAGFGRSANLARTTSQNQLDMLKPLYEGQRNDLQFGYNQNQSALDYQRQQLQDDTGFAGDRLQQQINPAILGARQNALRSGFNDASTIASDRVVNALNPITTQLGDLARRYQTGTSGIERSRQNYIENYQNQLQNLGNKERTEVKGVGSSLMQQLQALADQAISANATRNARVYARAGELGDQNKQFGLQNRQLTDATNLALLQLQEQGRQFNLGHELQKQTAGKL